MSGSDVMRCLWFAALLAGAAQAQTVSLSGSLGDKALLLIDGKPRTLAVGSTAGGVKLLSVNGSNAVVEIGGKRLTLAMAGAPANLGGSGGGPNGQQIVLAAGSGGHFITSGAINGHATRFLVDTGATFVSMGQAEAQNLGIDFRSGERGWSNTANGPIAVYHVSLTSVRVGDVIVYNVDATVVPVTLPFVLLGNSFLTRFQMKRENETMTLVKRP
jgi:aspartyl protease family protein